VEGAIYKVGSTRDFKPGSHVPSDLLLLEDAQSMQIKTKYIGSLAAGCFKDS
jgi:hypothetical protein